MMEQAELKQILESLIKNWEDECIEFKRDWDNGKSKQDKLGQYFSALANEANLRSKDCAWFVVGVDDKTRKIVGTNYLRDLGKLQSLKQQIAENTTGRVTFRDIHVLDHELGRVVMMQIPATAKGIPMSWKGHYYGRAGESLGALSDDKRDSIRNQPKVIDWSAEIVEGASIADLDEAACQHARAIFTQKNASRIAEDKLNEWPLETILDRAGVTQNSQITRTALLLLGKPEEAYRLSPQPAQITWSLEESHDKAYKHFGPPFLLTTTELYQRIRNIKIRLLPRGELLQYEVDKYDQQVVLEALHNCLAHQDYTKNARILVAEYPEKLIFESTGSFFEGHPDEYVSEHKTIARYRNLFLTQAMHTLSMIDKVSYGIRDMFEAQRKRYLPLPDYDLSSDSVVKLTVYGGIIDFNYTAILMKQSDLGLHDALALDRVQKKLPITENAVKRLRRARLIEGRKPNFRISSSVAAVTDQRADYIRTRPLDDEYYLKLLSDYLEKFHEADRTEINKLLLPKLSEHLNDNQKIQKINNLLTKWRRQGYIVNQGSTRHPKWILLK
ncbi:MAG: RNA-binding domain-containing protein [Pseudomonadota bacterium]